MKRCFGQTGAHFQYFYSPPVVWPQFARNSRKCHCRELDLFGNGSHGGITACWDGQQIFRFVSVQRSWKFSKKCETTWQNQFCIDCHLNPCNSILHHLGGHEFQHKLEPKPLCLAGPEGSTIDTGSLGLLSWSLDPHFHIVQLQSDDQDSECN